MALTMPAALDGGNLLRKSSSAAVVVPSSTAMDCSWISSAASSLRGGGSGILAPVGCSGVMLESSASATDIGGGRMGSGTMAISSDIQLHLQSMFHVLRPEETLKMVCISEFLMNLFIAFIGSHCLGQYNKSRDCCLIIMFQTNRRRELLNAINARVFFEKINRKKLYFIC